MRDIFLSYDFRDYKAATKLAALFQSQGWTVWKELSGYGLSVSGAAETELRGAKVWVVLWSRKAAESIIFRASLDREGPSPIFHVLLERGETSPVPPYAVPFDLSDWDGSTSHAGAQRLLSNLRLLRGLRSAMATPPQPAGSPASLEELSLSKIKENAMLAFKEGADARREGEGKFGGVFISYRRSEASAYAGRLYDRLAARFGKEKVFIDTENVGWGEDFVEAITAAAESCAAMIVLISPRWSRGAEEDDYVRLEVVTALGRKIRVIPILIQGATMPAPKELPEELAPLVRRNALALSDTRWERDVEDLIKNLESLLKD